MIGESSGVTTLINNERITRENQVGPENSKKTDQSEEALEGKFSDVTSFSSEALALAKNVVPVGGTAEQEQAESQGFSQQNIQNTTSRFLDIRV